MIVSSLLLLKKITQFSSLFWTDCLVLLDLESKFTKVPRPFQTIYNLWGTSLPRARCFTWWWQQGKVNLLEICKWVRLKCKWMHGQCTPMTAFDCRDHFKQICLYDFKIIIHKLSFTVAFLSTNINMRQHQYSSIQNWCKTESNMHTPVF